MDVVAPAPSQPSLRRKALTSFASFAIPVLIALIAMPILYRAMGASAFGILSIALITPTFAMSFDFGMSNAAVRRIADDLQIQSPTLGATLGGYSIALSTIGLVLGAVLALAASTLASLLGFEKTVGQDGTTLLRFCALWATITLVLALPGIVLRAQQRFALITAVQTATTIALWLTLLMLAIYDRPIVEMVAAAILLTALTGFISAWLARSQLPAGLRFKADFRAVRADARFSFGLSLLQLSNVLAFQLDRVIVSALASPAAAGTYALCVGLANKTLFGIASLTSFAFPAVASLRAEGRNADVASLLQVLQRVAIISMAAILVPALFLSAPFLSLWLRTALQPGTIELLQLLWVGYAIAAIGAPATHVITGTGTSRLAAVFAWVTALTLLGTMALLVPSYGLIGAGVANMTAMSTALIFLLLVRRQLRVIQTPGRARFWMGLLGGMTAQALLLVSAVPYVTNWGAFVLAGTASLAMFIAMRWITRTVTAEERRLIHSIASRLRMQHMRQGPHQR